MYIIYVTGESYIDHSYTIVKELKNHISLSIYFFAREKNEEVNNWLEKFKAVYVKRSRFRNIFSLFRELVFLLKLRSSRADCVWFDTMTIYQAFFAKFLLKNYLIMVHDVELHPESKDKHGKLSVKLTLKYYLDKTAVASKTQALELEKKYGFYPKVFQLPIIDYFKDVADPGKVTPSAGKIRYFFFGTIEEYKGVETLLQAAEILDGEGVDYELNIYGKLKYDENVLLERIKSAKNINLANKFIDYKNLCKIYEENDVIILPYKQVTQCGPLLIGYCWMTPAICNNLPGFLEYVDDGKSGLIFNNTAEELALKMKILMANPSKLTEMKQYIRTVTHNKFSMKALAEEYINNFKSP